MLHLVDVLNRILDTKIEPVFEAERPGDVKHSLADISRAKEKLEFRVITRFEEGLSEFVKEMNV